MAHESQHHHQGLGYTNFSSTAGPVMQSFGQPNQDQLYSLHNSDAWRAFGGGGGGGSANNAALSFPQSLMNENLMCPWPPTNRMLVDESSARFLFPSSCEAGSAPQSVASSGLSLSLNHAADASHAHHSAAAAYEQPLFHQHQLVHDDHKPTDYLQHGRFLQPSSISNNPYHQLKSSKFLLPARELLNEFCNVEAAESGSSKQKASKSKQWAEGGPSSSSTAFNQSLISSLDIHELQGRKAKLLAMLEEVDRRYRKYREQMRAVVASFEAVAGEGAAAAYSSLASKVMSRHFRCLRDGIVGQIRVIKNAAGEKDDAIAPGTTRGETPRLKVIDQCLRQHRAFQQGGMMENHPWRPQRGLPERSVSILRAWLFEHFLHPYPSDVDKHILARQTGLSRSQVSNWFINARVRLWKPMVEEMYMEETKEHESQEENDNMIYNAGEVNMEDQKPAHAVDPDSLSWLISKNSQNPNAGAENFGAIDLDFASYNNQNFGSGVSLTLGLQQHNGGGGSGVNLSFSPPAVQPTPTPSTLFFAREGMEECHPSQFSLLDGEAQINVPYRNLMGAQLLRDLAG
ncbi:hypothetical protein Cni_G14470 [Canna indica]|uniref:Homeobox domain-containing protein n=1 Tax=Canna indica TaxID=4628 RepID=A0AAQ3KBR4_9LILI|nr:hypothetical protein Cni_G14470 [Canna indica]